MGVDKDLWPVDPNFSLGKGPKIKKRGGGFSQNQILIKNWRKILNFKYSF